MQRFILLLFLTTSPLLFSQKKYTKEFTLLSDNDLYTSFYRDGYYSNGIFLSYTYLSTPKNKKLEKRIVQFKAGQMMFTPYKATIISPALHDRPFAGYLFAQHSVNRFYKNESSFKTSLQLGIIGPDSKAEDVQDAIHKIYNFPKAVGWKYQIHEAFAFNIGLNYLKLLTRTANKLVDLSSSSTLNIGTVFTNLSTGIYMRIGLRSLQKVENTIAFHSNLNSDKRKEKEAFFYLKPTVHYVLYDATIQGSFLNKTSPITFDVMPFVLQLESGIQFAAKRFNYGYAIHYHTKKLKSAHVPKSNLYGTLFVSYNFN